jgi:hypothetical protein
MSAPWLRNVSGPIGITPLVAATAVVICLFLSVAPCRAQGFSGETQIGSDGHGESYFSQYVFYDRRTVNLQARYFWINHRVNRGEFAGGPTFGLDGTTVKLQFGGTSDGYASLGGVLISSIAGRSLFYVADGKIAAKSGGTSKLFQLFFFAFNKRGNWQFALQDMQRGEEQQFLRLGIEYRHRLPKNTQLYLSPYFDPIKTAVGGHFGFRFF